MSKKFLKRNYFSLVLSVVLSFAFVLTVVNAGSTISTNITTAGNLTVSGDSTFGDAATDVNLFTGTLQASTTALFSSGLTTYGAGSVFNENSGALDFRVESDGQANMLYVDGTNNKVGSASSTPWGQFSVEAGSLNSDDPIFVVGDQGTSTPRFIVHGNAGSIGIGTSTPAQELSHSGDILVTSAATTSIIIDTPTASTGGCLQMRGVNGTTYRAYLVATTASQGVVASWQITAGSCQ